jgi:hypothetical protein
MPVSITEASEASLAVAPLMQGSDEDCEIWQVPGRDLGSRRQMLQAVGVGGSGRTVPEDRLDPSFLGAGEHGGAIVADQHHVGQQPGPFSGFDCRPGAPLADVGTASQGAPHVGLAPVCPHSIAVAIPIAYTAVAPRPLRRSRWATRRG